MPNYSFVCRECSETTEAQFKYEERPEHVNCAQCGGEASYVIAAPNVMQHAYHDGVKRKGWTELREASKLNREAANAKPENKREIEKQIRKLGYNFKKEGI